MAKDAYHCKGKARFRSEHRAKRAKQGHTYRLKTYCCHHCGGWHNGNDDGFDTQDEWKGRDRRERITGMRLREAAEAD